MVIPVDTLEFRKQFHREVALKWEQYKEYALNGKSLAEIQEHKITFYTAILVADNLLSKKELHDS